MSHLQGGKFGHGFVSAGFTKWSTQYFNGVQGWKVGNISLAQTTVAALVGGTVSHFTGGKFANGAITAAMGNILNEQKAGNCRSLECAMSRNDQMTKSNGNWQYRENHG